MKPLEEAKKLDPEGINREILERRDLIQDLGGRLYPPLLWDEVYQLRKVYVEKTGKIDFIG